MNRIFRKNKAGEPIEILPDGIILKGCYKINYLTAGGMGVVYFARNLSSGSKFVIKEAINKSSESVVGLIQEKETIMRLDHPGIVKYEDFFIEFDSSFLVLEYIEGEDLDSVLEKIQHNFLPEEKVIDWGIQLCRIFTYLHSQKPPIIFKDLKPGNIMLREDGKIILFDFGIARLKKGKGADTQYFGSLGYASPEHCKNPQKLRETDERSDIYTLGATLHHLITNRHPITQPFSFPPVTSFNRKASKEIENIIDKAIQNDPNKRYQSALSMKQDLEKIGSKILGNNLVFQSKISSLMSPKSGIYNNPICTSSPAKKVCFYCRFLCDYNAGFCNSCGSDLLRRKIKCKFCRYLNDGDAVFCNLCGKKII